MPREHLTTALEACLRALAQGATIERVLEGYPHLSRELRPLLEAALQARMVSPGEPAPSPSARSRSRLMAAARAASRSRRGAIVFVPRLRTAMASLLLAGGLALAGTGSLVASARSLPGDALYPLKILRERTRIRLTSSAAQRLDLELAYDQERTREVEALIAQSRSDKVEFAGALTRHVDGRWVVAGLQVHVPPGVAVDQDLVVGAYVEVRGVLAADGSILADRLQVHVEHFAGVLQYASSTHWVVSGAVLSMGPESEIRNDPQVGDTVEVDVMRLANGSLLVQTATVIRRAAASSTPRAIPDLQTTPSPEDEGEATEVEESHETPEAEATKEGQGPGDGHETPRPTRTPEPEGTPSSGDGSNPSKTPEPTDND